MTADAFQKKSTANSMSSGLASARVRRAQGVIFWERLWPVLLIVLAPAFVYFVASLFAIWRVVPSTLHWGAALVTLAATALAIYRKGEAAPWPTRREALDRLEEGGGLKHAPLQAIEDRPFGESSAPSPLWRAHVEEMRRLAARARLKGPFATADAQDPYALRFAAVGLLAVALVAAGAEWRMRIAEGLNPGAARLGSTALADLWIEPPTYTGKAPIYLLKAGAKIAGQHPQIDAPEGSTVIAQVSNARRFKLVFRGAAAVEKGPSEQGRATLRLIESGAVTLKVGAAEGRWPVGVIGDEPPTVAFTEPPSTTDDARLSLALALWDDYGIAKAVLELRLQPDQQLPLDAPGFDEASIRQTRRIEMQALAGKPGERRIDVDLQEDPWAGLFVKAKIIVTDAAGNSGESEDVATRLPERPFFNPLAKVVIEQRRTLAVAADHWPRAARSFDALTLAPDRFYDRGTDYLLMRAAFWRVMRNQDDDFKDTVEAFWPLALQLEDEALELARQRLEAAQEALRQALENNASDQDIEKLVEALRDAMRQYLQALAQSGRQMAQGDSSGGQALSESDLESMLDQIRDLSQSGARNAARQALSDLENLLNNLRMAQQGAGQGGGGDGASGQGGAAGQAGDLIGRQRDLSNRSFERGQDRDASGDDLAGEEDALAEDLQKLLDEVGRGGAPDPSSEGQRKLGRALEEMRDAERALRSDDFGAATSAMERAIANLRDGAQSLAQGAQQAGREGQGQDRAGFNTDPLGRPAGEAYGSGVEVPEGSDAQRAREVIEELRRRLSDGRRNEEDLRYLERLLERF